jgi:hypothetical protein
MTTKVQIALDHNDSIEFPDLPTCTVLLAGMIDLLDCKITGYRCEDEADYQNLQEYVMVLKEYGYLKS